jgi:hypothetical protein
MKLDLKWLTVATVLDHPFDATWNIYWDMKAVAIVLYRYGNWAVLVGHEQVSLNSRSEVDLFLQGLVFGKRSEHRL